MQTTIKPMIADWYDAKHFEDWQHETVKPGEEYYLIEYVKEHIDVVSVGDIRTYLDLEKEASESELLDELDNQFLGWSTETATGKE